MTTTDNDSAYDSSWLLPDEPVRGAGPAPKYRPGEQDDAQDRAGHEPEVQRAQPVKDEPVVASPRKAPAWEASDAPAVGVGGNAWDAPVSAVSTAERGFVEPAWEVEEDKGFGVGVSVANLPSFPWPASVGMSRQNLADMCAGERRWARITVKVGIDDMSDEEVALFKDTVVFNSARFGLVDVRPYDITERMVTLRRPGMEPKKLRALRVEFPDFIHTITRVDLGRAYVDVRRNKAGLVGETGTLTFGTLAGRNVLTGEEGRTESVALRATTVAGGLMPWKEWRSKQQDYPLR